MSYFGGIRCDCAAHCFSFWIPLLFNVDSVNWSLFELTAHVAKTAVFIFAVCILAHWVYRAVAEPILNRIMGHFQIPVIDLNEE